MRENIDLRTTVPFALLIDAYEAKEQICILDKSPHCLRGSKFNCRLDRQRFKARAALLASLGASLQFAQAGRPQLCQFEQKDCIMRRALTTY